MKQLHHVSTCIHACACTGKWVLCFKFEQVPASYQHRLDCVQDDDVFKGPQGTRLKLQKTLSHTAASLLGLAAGISQGQMGSQCAELVPLNQTPLPADSSGGESHVPPAPMNARSEELMDPNWDISAMHAQPRPTVAGGEHANSLVCLGIEISEGLYAHKI